MKNILILSSVLLFAGCATSQPVQQQVAWPSDCSVPEPQWLKTWHSNHRVTVIRDICYSTVGPVANYRSAFDARINQIRTERQMMNSIRVR